MFSPKELPIETASGEHHSTSSCLSNSAVTGDLRLRYRSAVWLLLAQLFFVGVYLTATGGLTLIEPRKDSIEYIDLSHAPITTILRSHRSLGYPLWIRAVRATSLELIALPYLNLILHGAVALILFFALAQYSSRCGAAFGAASGFVYSILNDGGPAQVMTDFPSRTLIVLVIALLFWLCAKPRCAWLWSGITMAIFASYMVRPLYIFMAGLLPLLGVIFNHLRNHETTARARIRFGGMLLAVSILPLLLFCGGRYAVTGNFGVTSLSGFCLMGITTHLLTPEVIDNELPPQHRELAHKIAAARKTAKLPGLYASGHGSQINWEGWFSSYREDRGIAARVTAEHFGIAKTVTNSSGTLWAQLDKPMGALGLAIVKAKPEMYGLFVIFNARRGLGRLFEYSRVAQFMGLLLLTLFLLRILLLRNRNPPALSVTAPPDPLSPALLCTTVLFPLLSIVLISLVELTRRRYMFSAGVFFTPFIGMLLWGEVLAWREGWKLRTPNETVAD